MPKANELRDQKIDELQASVIEKRRELFNLLNELQQSKKLEKPHLIRKTKKEIAQLLTIINEKQLANT